MTYLAGFVVFGFAIWLLGLTLLILLRPASARDFLRAFASSPKAHYLEQSLRLLGGIAFVLYAGQMVFPRLFTGFGWLLVTTAVILLVLPWRWHHRFGQWCIPILLRHLTPFALGALFLGLFILYCQLGPLFALL